METHSFLQYLLSGLRLSAANVIFTYTLFYVPETCSIFGCDNNCHVRVTCIIKTVERQNIIRNTEAQEKWNDGGASKITRRAVGGCEGAKPRNRIQRLDSAPTPLEFLRDYVSPNKPCIISNAISHWPALSLWPNLSYLSSSLSDSIVSLHLTPDGRADSLVPLETPKKGETCFASAHVEHVPFPCALDLVLNSETKNVVGYLQQQNDCFREEYSVLASDCDAHIPWATEALGGCLPEAVNLWIGNHSSESSFHRDHYENLYAVVSGEKQFLLLPPTDVHRMYIQEYPAAQYSYSSGSGEFRLELEKPQRYVPWCRANPYPPPETEENEMSKFPLYFKGPKPFHCTVKAGEILYLPSMWFHHVRQSPDDNGCTIAINYWYDMQFDIKYAYFNFLQSIHHGSTLMNYDATKFTLSDELCIDANELEAEEANQVDTKDE